MLDKELTVFVTHQLNRRRARLMGPDVEKHTAKISHYRDSNKRADLANRHRSLGAWRISRL